jgi:hypothetical protein
VEYSDFDLDIERRGEGRYLARVLDSLGMQATHEFTLPFSSLELDNFLLRMGHARGAVRRLESPQTQIAKQMGGRLFDAVVVGPIATAFASSLKEARTAEKGLRIRLRLTHAPELCDIPWEFLYDRGRNKFLGLSRETPIVRFLELPDSPRPLIVKPPLAALVMISSPSDYQQLDVEKEWNQLAEALRELAEAGYLTVDRLPVATLGQLRRQLSEGEYHIFHYVGHAGFMEDVQDGALVLTDEKGRGRVVGGQDLGVLLGDHPSLRLVVLNACEGARAGKADPFAGCAQSLVQQGIPAVIAMQFEISDGAAIAFSHEFYDALAAGLPVDAALVEARKAIFAGDTQIEWGTPVLHMRTEDGRVFDVAEPSNRRQLKEMWVKASNSLDTQRWSEAVDALRALLALDPGARDPTRGSAGDLLARALRQKEKAALPPPPGMRPRQSTAPH